MSLSDRLREVRALAGVSARDASAIAGLSPSHVALLEAGRHRATADTVSRLARAFGCSIDWLVDGSGKAPTARAVRAAVVAARERARAIVG
jgi:transcriptional regulator with XRE-family HTH domain